MRLRDSHSWSFLAWSVAPESVAYCDLRRRHLFPRVQFQTRLSCSARRPLYARHPRCSRYSPCRSLRHRRRDRLPLPLRASPPAIKRVTTVHERTRLAGLARQQAHIEFSCRRPSQVYEALCCDNRSSFGRQSTTSAPIRCRAAAFVRCYTYFIISCGPRPPSPFVERNSRRRLLSRIR